MKVGPRTVISAQYFIYFGVLGFYLPYFNLYCYHIGFSGVQIGTLSAIRSAAIIVFPILWGKLADRFGSGKPIFVFCCLAGALCWSLYLFTADFKWMAAITLAYGVFYAPLISLMETFSMKILGAEKRGYGKIRAWGSLSFILAAGLTGELIETHSARIIIVLILAGSLVQTMTALKIPDAPPPEKRDISPGGDAFFGKDLARFLVCAFFMLASHSAYYGFFSIHIEKLGYDGSFIGACWAVAVLAEILVMVRSKWLFARFSMERLILISMVAAAARWFTLFLAKSPVPLLLSQTAHALTYGAFHMAGILYIDRISPEHSKTLGQAVNNAVTYGLGLTAGFIANGFLYEKFETRHLFLFSGVVAMLAGLLFLFPLKRHKRP